MMKKVYLMKGMAAMAFGLVVTSCNKMDLFNANAEQEAKEKEFTENFQSVVMGGQTIDPNQTWSTTTPVQVSVTPRTSGTLKIYATSPIGNAAAALYTVDVTAGNKTTFTVTKPADAAKLYAAVYDADGMIDDMLSFEANGAAEVIFNKTASNRAARRTAPDMPSLENYPTPAKPTAPTDMPTAENADYKILAENSPYTSYGFEIDKTYYIAPGVTVILVGEYAGLNDRTKIYMGAGSTLKKETGTLFLGESVLYNDGGTIEAVNFDVNKGVLWNDGTFKLSGTLSATNDNAKIYNAANRTIEAKGITLTNNSQLLYNEGTLDIDGDINYYNTDATIVNDGKIKAENMLGRAGGSLFNLTDREVEIADSTIVNNSNSPWVNYGTFTTDKFKVIGGSTKVFNNCRLTATDRFIIGGDGSYFILQGDASVIAEDFDWNGDAYFWMGADSWLKVNGTLKSNNDDDNYGFYQYGDNYAVISADAITTDNVDGQSRIWLEGKIYVDANEMFELKYVDAISKNNHYYDTNVKFTGKMYTAPVPEAWKTATDCRPAYTPGEKKENTTQWYYYAFEDLGTTDDFDFNDVILRVSAPVNGKSAVELVAAGGTLPTYLFYNGELLSETEVHSLIGAASVTDMVNTGRGSKKPFVKVTDIDVTSDTELDNLSLGIGITSENGQTTRVTRSVENNGNAPLVIVVNGDDNGKWFWPTERTTISVAYSGFGAWGANVSNNTDWYKNATGSVYEW